MGGHRISPLTDHYRPIRPAPTHSPITARRFLRADEEAPVKRAEEVMEILEAYDLVGTLRGAARAGSAAWALRLIVRCHGPWR